MSEITALQRHACPECGGDAQWTPAKRALVCPYCGTVVPGQARADGVEVRENDLIAALRQAASGERGWKEERASVKCQSCQAISVFEKHRIGQRCDFCGSAAIVPQEEARDPIRPESVLPVRVAEARVRDSLRAWFGSRWFAPNRFKGAALTDTLRGVYLPYWTFDARADAQWTAESGYYYYVTETYRDAQGNTQTRQARKIRWESSAGRVQHQFDDTLIAGSVGVHGDLLRRIEPFPTKNLVPYDPAFLRGWIVERYQLDLGQAAQRSKQVMDAEVAALCARQVPGDTHRNLRVATQYSNRTFKHVLLPVWFVSYTYGRRNFQVLVNGETGAIAGERPYSWVKIALAVLAGAAALGLLSLLAGLSG
jgi:hypothetical protein